MTFDEWLTKRRGVYAYNDGSGSLFYRNNDGGIVAGDQLDTLRREYESDYNPAVYGYGGNRYGEPINIGGQNWYQGGAQDLVGDPGRYDPSFGNIISEGTKGQVDQWATGKNSRDMSSTLLPLMTAAMFAGPIAMSGGGLGATPGTVGSGAVSGGEMGSFMNTLGQNSLSSQLTPGATMGQLLFPGTAAAGGAAGATMAGAGGSNSMNGAAGTAAGTAGTGGTMSNFMTPGNLMSLAGNLGGALIGANASRSAADTQASAADRAIGVQQQMFETIQQQLQPWLESGKLTLSQLQQLLGINENGTFDQNAMLVRPFGNQDFAADPGYQFRLNQGLDSVMNRRSAMGGINSGATMKELNDYAQGTASNEYDRAYGRYRENQGDVYGRLATMAGSGQNAAGNLGTFGMNTAAGIGSNIIGAGNAQAAGDIGTANAITGAGGNLINNYMMQQLIESMRKPQVGQTPSWAVPGIGYGATDASMNQVEGFPV